MRREFTCCPKLPDFTLYVLKFQTVVVTPRQSFETKFATGRTSVF